MNTSEQVMPANDEQSVLSFDGKDDYVVFPPIVADFSNGLTVEAYVRYFSFVSWSRIFHFGNAGKNDNNNFVFLNGPDNSLRFYVYSATIVMSKILDKNVWMHLAATVDKDGIGVLYKDGKTVKSKKLKIPSNIVRKLNYAGRNTWANNRYFHGQLSELRFWNTCRTKDEIKANVHNRLKGNESGLIGYWPMNEGAGNVIKDKTAVGNHAVFVS